MKLVTGNTGGSNLSHEWLENNSDPNDATDALSSCMDAGLFTESEEAVFDTRIWSDRKFAAAFVAIYEEKDPRMKELFFNLLHSN